MFRSETGIQFLGFACALALITPSTGFAANTAADNSELDPATPSLGLYLALDLRDPYFLAQNSASTTDTSVEGAATAADSNTRQTYRFGETAAGKGYLIPAEEIVGFNLLLNRFNYFFIDKKVYGSNLKTIGDNVTHKWIVDTDPLAVNQFLHPYQGSVYLGLARSTGLDYWESLGYTFGGSLLWEIAGETGLPSINDLFATGFGGIFLGEPLFRMASLLLEEGGTTPGFWRELDAAAISPSLGFTRLAYGEHYRKVFDSRNPATFTYMRIGLSVTDSVFDDLASQEIKRETATVDFHMSYGLPGKDGYTYRSHLITSILNSVPIPPMPSRTS